MKKFIKNQKQKRAIITSLIAIFLLIGVMVVYRSFAYFETGKTYNVIEGRIPNFSKGDVTFAVLVNDQIQTKIPKKDTGFKYIDSECTSGDDSISTTIRWDENEWAPTILNLEKSGTICTLKFESIYNSITVDGAVAKEFPDKGDYQVNMGCSNVESASWNYESWQPSIRGVGSNSSCNVIFKSTNSVITKITLDGNTIDKYPEKGSIKTPSVVCTNGGIGSWDNDKWMPVISNFTNSTTCTVMFSTSRLNEADPVIKDGLVPVTIANDGTVVKSSENANDWYDYDSSKWANAVILTGSDTYSVGATIPESAIESYFVWIPKYRYKLFNVEGNSISPQEIEIEIGDYDTVNSTTECIATNISGDIGTCTNGKWMTHPAFTSLGVNGFWVGKFGTTGSSSAPTIKPNATRQTMNVSSKYNLAYNYKRNLDSHMIKPTEWGAVVYLTSSKYGRSNTLVYNSSHAGGTTGCVANTATESAGWTCTNPWNSSIGYHGSTTDNITGVFDISSMYTMGYHEGTDISMAGFTASEFQNINKKYIDRYLGSVFANFKILGDSTAETNGWYNSRNNNLSSCFIMQNVDNIFGNGDGSGSVQTNNGMRIVLSPTS